LTDFATAADYLTPLNGGVKSITSDRTIPPASDQLLYEYAANEIGVCKCRIASGRRQSN
jgi:hypothetical protein